MSTLKAIKGGKTEVEPDVRTATFRGVTYTIREALVPEYKECLKAATNERGMTPFGDLLDQLVMRCVSPSPAAMEKPLPYPIYRMLEAIVNEMHFLDIESDEEKAAAEAEAKKAEAAEAGEAAPEAEAPNS